MKSAVIVFPGSNCDRDMAVALERATGFAPTMVWHKDAALPDGLDLVALPGGFSFGDYLRCGAIAAHSPIVGAVKTFAQRGGHVLGVCNGFQVLIEAGLLPGALMRNSGLKFVCRDVGLRVEDATSPFTRGYEAAQQLSIPVAHHDGCYIAVPETLRALNSEGRVAFRYTEAVNGSNEDIAGVLSENKRVLGMMPHPERAIDPMQGGEDGVPFFRALADSMALA